MHICVVPKEGAEKNLLQLIQRKVIARKIDGKANAGKKGYSMNYVFHAPRFEVYEYPRHADEKSRKIVKLME